LGKPKATENCKTKEEVKKKIGKILQDQCFSIHAMTYRRSRGIEPLTLNLGTRWR
jgi:hypothetical protein